VSDRLEPAEVARRLAQHPGWTFEGGAIIRTFNRGDFNGSLAFINAIANVANRLDHHPDLALSWNEVVVRTVSHDVDGISPRDFALIAAIDAL
jgi:4a-hydroxytetrahydrobiopterin dehydratase